MEVEGGSGKSRGGSRSRWRSRWRLEADGVSGGWRFFVEVGGREMVRV